MKKDKQKDTEIAQNTAENPVDEGTTPAEEVQVVDKKTKVKKVLNTSFTIVEVLVVVFLLIISLLSMSSTTTNASEVASNPITGTSLFPVLSDSMAPTFEAGDLVYGKQFSTVGSEDRIIEMSKLKSDETEGENKGDIIMYWSTVDGGRAIITHRIRKIDITGYTTINGTNYPVVSVWTRGDAEDATESYTLVNISNSDIVAYYKGHIKYVGAIIEGLQDNQALMFCVLVLPLILLFLWNGYSFVRMIFVNKKETAIEELQASHETEKAQLLEEAKRLALEELKKEMAKEAENSDKKEEK